MFRGTDVFWFLEQRTQQGSATFITAKAPRQSAFASLRLI
jgi:hypothetical protein